MASSEPYRTLARASLRDVFGTAMMVTGFQIYLWQLIYRTGLPLHSLATVAAGTLRSGSRQEYSPHEPLGGTFTDDLIELDGRSGLL